MHLTHNENIQTIDNAMCHLELEEEMLKFTKPTDVYMATPNLRKVSR